MGYSPAPPPTGIITLPEGSTPEDVDSIREQWRGPSVQLLTLGATWTTISDFGMQGADTRPTTPYQRYLHDLYGPPGRNWMPFLGAGLLLSVAALIVTVALMLGGIV